MKKKCLLVALLGVLCGTITRAADEYSFKGGYPSPETIRNAHGDADLNRAIQAYRLFYPTVSGAAIFKGIAKVGVIPNKSFGALQTQPRHVIFTANSDTPYGLLPLDLRDGPVVVELSAGPLICVATDIHQRWVADMGLPGPDAGNGGKHLLLPPGYKGEVPSGYHPAKSTSYRMLVGVRSLPIQGDVAGAIALVKSVNVHPLNPPPTWTRPIWIDLTDRPQDTTPLAWEDNLQYWQELHEAIESEPPCEACREHYGELATLGFVKGKPFAPNARAKALLERAAKIGCGQMRVASFADNRPDRIVWPDRKWEWAALRFEDGNFNIAGYTDLYARDKWYFQAIGSSPAMFRRSAGAGSLYWLGLRDKSGAYLDGGKTYKLSVPQPVPGRLFWSVTVYDAGTRSQIQTDQDNAALRSFFELKASHGSTMDLFFGPGPAPGHQRHWIKTIPGKGWFSYFRIYGPEEAAFDGSWKPDDFEAFIPESVGAAGRNVYEERGSGKNRTPGGKL